MRKRCCFVAICFLVIVTAGCGSKKVSKWELSEVGDRDSLAELNFCVENQEFELPTKLESFVDEESGWKLVADNVLYRTGIMPESVGTVQIGSDKYVNDSGINNFAELTLENKSEQTTTELSSCEVVGYRIRWTGNNTTPNVVLRNGVNWSSSADAVKKAYGTPDVENNGALVYSDDTWEAIFSFSEGKLSDISFLYKNPDSNAFSNGE